MHILYLIQYFGPPDNCYASGRSWDFALNWAKKGHNVTVITTDAFLINRKLPVNSPLSNLHIHVLPQFYHNSFSILRRLSAFVGYIFQTLLLLPKLPRFDLVYASSTPLTVGFLGQWISKKLGIPFFLELRDLWPDFPLQMLQLQKSRLATFLFKWEHRLYYNADMIVSLSKDSFRRLKHEKGVNKKKLLLIPNGYTEPIEPISPLPKRSKTIYLLYAGSLGRANNIPWILELLRLTHHHELSVHCTIIGEGYHFKTIENFIASFPKSSPTSVQLFHAISRNDLWPFIIQSDIMLLPFLSLPILELNSPNKLFDAVACNKPIITTIAHGWIPELLKKYGVGFVCPNVEEALSLLLNWDTYQTQSPSSLFYAKRSRFDRTYLAEILSEEFSKYE